MLYLIVIRKILLNVPGVRMWKYQGDDYSAGNDGDTIT